MTHRLSARFVPSIASFGVSLSLGFSLFLANRHAEWKQWNAVRMEDEEVSHVLEANRQTLMQQNALKQEILDDLCSGRMPLKEATERFLALDRGWPQVQTHIHEAFPGTSDAESEARCLVLMACNSVRSPSLRTQLIDRLTGEFGRLYPDSTQISLVLKYDCVFMASAR